MSSSLSDAPFLHPHGGIGSGASRTYSTGISYDEAGRLRQEQFGTTTPVYNKLFYNLRGQLSEIRVGTTPNDTGWNRGAIINHYRDQTWAGSARGVLAPHAGRP